MPPFHGEVLNPPPLKEVDDDSPRPGAPKAIPLALAPAHAPSAQIRAPKPRKAAANSLMLEQTLTDNIHKFMLANGLASFDEAIKMLLKMGLSSSPLGAALGTARQNEINRVRFYLFGEMTAFFNAKSLEYKVARDDAGKHLGIPSGDPNAPLTW